MKTASRLMAALAASALAMTPIAAQAGTRAGDSTAVYSVSAPGEGRAADGESVGQFPAFLTVFLVIVGVGFFTFLVTNSSNNGGRSPGT